MKKETPEHIFVDPIGHAIQNCLVTPWYPYFGRWPSDNYIGDFLENQDFTPTIGKIFSAPLKNKTSLVSPQAFVEARFDKQVWFSNENGADFVLEVPGYGPENISVEIKHDGWKFLEVRGSKENRSFTENFDIPNAESLDFGDVKAEVKHGILTVSFKKKVVAPKTIKVL